AAWSRPPHRCDCLLGSRLQVPADPPAGRIGADRDSRRTSLGVSWQAAAGSGSHATATNLTTLPGQARMAKATCAIRAAVAMLGEELDETAGGFLGSFFLDACPDAIGLPSRCRPSHHGEPARQAVAPRCATRYGFSGYEPGLTGRPGATNPASKAITTSWARSRAPSLDNTRVMWVRTVAGLMTRR